MKLLKKQKQKTQSHNNENLSIPKKCLYLNKLWGFHKYFDFYTFINLYLYSFFFPV